MRLDKYLCSTGTVSRSEAGKLVRTGNVTVNGAVIKRPDTHIDENSDAVTLCGEPVAYRHFTYVMLNKPEGYVSATEDGNAPVIMELLPENLRKQGLFPCGRLDKYTVGLIILTNNGKLAHRLLAPKHHVDKTYAFRVSDQLSGEDVTHLEAGVDIGGYVTAPATVSMEDPYAGHITIHEGKYHQIKLMMDRIGTKITYLERVTFGPLSLDPQLARGAWRYLSDEEQQQLEALGE